MEWSFKKRWVWAPGLAAAILLVASFLGTAATKMFARSRARSYLHQAVSDRNAGHLDPALHKLTESIRLDPTNALAYDHRGFIYNLQDRYDRAVADFTESLKINPDDSYALHGRAWAYRHDGEYAKAVADYKDLLRQCPQNLEANAEMAVLLAEAPDDNVRDTDAAILHATLACQLSHCGNPYFLSVLSRSYAACGRLDEAIRVAEKAAAIAPEEVRPHFEAFLQTYLNSGLREPFRIDTNQP
jgi:tetratricopeptide (TPR) repeat protein